MLALASATLALLLLLLASATLALLLALTLALLAVLPRLLLLIRSLVILVFQLLALAALLLLPALLLALLLILAIALLLLALSRALLALLLIRTLLFIALGQILLLAQLLALLLAGTDLILLRLAAALASRLLLSALLSALSALLATLALLLTPRALALPALTLILPGLLLLIRRPPFLVLLLLLAFPLLPALLGTGCALPVLFIGAEILPFPFGKLLLRFVLADAVFFLQLADQPVAIAGDNIQFVVGEFSPATLDCAFELFPVAFDTIPVHLQFPHTVEFKEHSVFSRNWQQDPAPFGESGHPVLK